MILVLFDIDGTILRSAGAGLRAMERAAQEMFGAHVGVSGIEFAGRLDPIIYDALIAAHGLADASARHDEFRERYGRHLMERLDAGHPVQVLPGVVELLDRLEAEASVVLGLVTGNYAETGRAKIRAAGIDPDRFRIAAWGDDGPTRRDLPRVAMERHAGAFGAAPDPARVVVIGDTPHDVDCARANGCRAIAVATGPGFDAATLSSHAPDLLLEDLSAVEEIAAWILGPATAGRGEPVDAGSPGRGRP